MFSLSCVCYAFVCVCLHAYMILVVTCWKRAGLLALVCGVKLLVSRCSIGILGQVWYLIVLIPDLCTLTDFHIPVGRFKSKSCQFHTAHANLIPTMLFSAL